MVRSEPVTAMGLSSSACRAVVRRSLGGLDESNGVARPQGPEILNVYPPQNIFPLLWASAQNERFPPITAV